MERALDERLRARAQRFDAPVSGAASERATPRSPSCGGDGRRSRASRPVLALLGRTITFWAPPAGAAPKLCNQILVSVSFWSERGAGLRAASAVSTRRHRSSGVGRRRQSWQYKSGPRIMQAGLRPGFMVDLVQKDLRLSWSLRRARCFHCPRRSGEHCSLRPAHGCGAEGRKAWKVVERLSGLKND